MKHRITLSLVLLLCLAASPLSAQSRLDSGQPRDNPGPGGTDPALQRLGNGIAANVEGEIITVEQLRNEIQPILPRIRSEARNQREFVRRLDKVSQEILQNMIDRILIEKKAEEKGLLIPDSFVDREYNKVIEEDFDGDRTQFLEYLRNRGQTPDEFREQLRRRVVVNVMRRENQRSESEISPEKIEEYYVENKLRFYQPESIHLRQIILRPMAGESMDVLRQKADEIVRKLDQGGAFGDLARQYSQDDMSRSGGDWGWIEQEDIRNELSEVAFDLGPGEASKAVEIDNTIFILYCEDRREEKIQPLSEVREVIEESLVGDIARETQERWLKRLRKDSFVRTYL